MEINERMKECLREANDRYPDYDWEEVVHEAFETYLVLNGGPYEVEDDDEAMALVKTCAQFLVQLTINSLMDQGLVELAGMDENGDITYQLAQP